MSSEPKAPSLLRGDELDLAVQALPRVAGAALVTNLHGPASATLAGATHADAVRMDRAIAWLTHDAGASRIHVAGVDQAAAAEVMRALPHSQLPTVLDVVSSSQREASQMLRAAEDAGLSLVTRYARIACRTAPRTRPPRAPVRRLGSERAVALWAALHRDFDPRLDHLPTRDACEALARDGQVLLAPASPELDAYVVYRVAGQAFDFAYLVNRTGDPFALDELLRALYQDVRDRGLSRGTAWVDVRKPEILALHKRFGLLPDGVVVDIFERVTPGR